MTDDRPLEASTPADPLGSPPLPKPPRPPWSRFSTRWWLYARWVVPCLLAMVLGLTAGISLFVFTHAQVFTGNRVLTRPTPDAKTFSWPLTLSNRVNIILIGIDVSLGNKRQLLSFARSDTLMLVSFDPERNEINALSIPRDTRVQIPGKGADKINAAYAYGGPRLTIRTVQSFLGVPINYYVKLGPESFARFIDAIGGIEIDVEKKMKYKDWWGGLNIDLKKGQQLLNGDQAAGYIRFRHDDMADFGRVARQQKMLLALFEKVKSPSSLVHAPQLLRAFMGNTQTNLLPSEMITLGMFAARLKSSDVHTATMPGQAGPVYVEADMAKTRALVAQMFYGVDKDALASTGIELINASGVPGLARKTAERLQQLGFKIVRIDSTAPVADVTTIIDRNDRPRVARLLADLFARSRIIKRPGAGPDITVVLARDQARQAAVTLARQ